MRRRGWCAALALLGGCSNLSAPKGQAVSLELSLPVPPAVEQNDTVHLLARALDINGDSVAAVIVWRTADTTLIAVDSNGRFTTTLTSGTGRVQAVTGTLRSALTTLSIRPRSDTLAITLPDTVVVAATDTASAPMVASVLSNNPAGGVSGTSILYEVDSPDQQRIADTAHFSGDLSALRVSTGSSGAPLTSVTLRRKSATWKDTIHVRVSASRPSGTPVPGSGQLFTILFQ